MAAKALGIPFAAGDPSPAWPVPETSSREGIVRASRMFGARRSGGETVHTGIDIGHRAGEPVVATEAGEVIRIQGPTWAGDTPSSAVLIATDSGIVINLGEVDPNTLRVHKGSRVEKGQRVGDVSPTTMLHIETYRKGTTQTHRWLAGDPPPPELLDPSKYVMRAAGVKIPGEKAAGGVSTAAVVAGALIIAGVGVAIAAKVYSPQKRMVGRRRNPDNTAARMLNPRNY
jgi:murein DD-endopeptidase MepM/ murein hydrolase activator NlpD